MTTLTLTLRCPPPQLYPPPSTSPPPSVVAQGERENVRFADAEFYRSQGTTIDQDECFKPHKKTSYDRKGVMVGSACHPPLTTFHFVLSAILLSIPPFFGGIGTTTTIYP